MKKNEFIRFFNACNPAKTLDMRSSHDMRYYIDFSSVRGGKVIEELERAINFSDDPTYQLFTGSLGCGKSTELLKLKTALENKGFHVVYFVSSEDLDTTDVEISDILLALVRRVSESLEEINIRIKPNSFIQLFKDITDRFIQLDFKAEFSVLIAKITAQTKESPKLRNQLREYLEPKTSNILQSINNDFLSKAINKLKEQNQRGLVVIVDNLDRIDPRPTPMGIPQPEYLFIDRGSQLQGLDCHVVYTIPPTLNFSDRIPLLVNRWGGIFPKTLPVVPVRLQDNSDFYEGIYLLKQMVLARAFPFLQEEQRINKVTEVFDEMETLNRLCRVSGGHVRNLLGMLYQCIQRQNLPIQRKCLEQIVNASKERFRQAVKEDEFNLLYQVWKNKRVDEILKDRDLLFKLLVFEYRSSDNSSWFDINPLLAEIAEIKAKIESNNN